jgi:hypothetical protein
MRDLHQQGPQVATASTPFKNPFDSAARVLRQTLLMLPEYVSRIMMGQEDPSLSAETERPVMKPHWDFKFSPFAKLLSAKTKTLQFSKVNLSLKMKFHLAW